ncbi:MAG: helix-turn-helix domain-containing protein [Actinomycetota bacterium]
MAEEIKHIFGQILRELRAERQLSQEALADLARCHVNQISFLERGVNGPSLDLVFRLAEALGVPPSDLIARIEGERKLPRSASPT